MLPEGLLAAVAQATGIPINEFFFDRKRPQKNYQARHLVYGLLWYEFGGGRPGFALPFGLTGML